MYNYTNLGLRSRSQSIQVIADVEPRNSTLLLMYDNNTHPPLTVLLVLLCTVNILYDIWALLGFCAVHNGIGVWGQSICLIVRSTHEDRVQLILIVLMWRIG